MKKFLISFLLIGLPLSLGAKTLYEYFGGKLPTVAQRAPIFRQYFPRENYQGTASQNERFVSKLTLSPLLGAIFTTISSTDQLSNFPSTYNTNLAQSANTTTANTWSGLQLFNGQASSTLFSCYGTCYFGSTATSSFSTAGALTLTTPLTVGNGGTGSTTLSSNQILLGNGTGAVSTVSGWGANNQVLGSNGGTSAPTWRTFATDLTSNYSWTGFHTIVSSSTGQLGLSTTTLSTALGVNGNAYVSGTTTTGNLVLASSTLSNTNGTNIQFPAGLGMVQSILLLARNLAVGTTVGTNATTTLATVFLPSNTLQANDSLQIDLTGTSSGGSGCQFGIDIGNGASTGTIAYFSSNITNSPVYGINATLHAASATSQYSFAFSTTQTQTSGFASSSTFSLTSPLYLAFVGQAFNANSTCTLRGYSVAIKGN